MSEFFYSIALGSEIEHRHSRLNKNSEDIFCTFVGHRMPAFIRHKDLDHGIVHAEKTSKIRKTPL